MNPFAQVDIDKDPFLAAKLKQKQANANVLITDIAASREFKPDHQASHHIPEDIQKKDLDKNEIFTVDSVPTWMLQKSKPLMHLWPHL